MDKGTYCLVFRNPACTVRTGALGNIVFRAGWHVYVGSALGSGGLKRLERHIALAGDRNRSPKWHVDYLLTNPDFQLSSAVYACMGTRMECRVAAALGGDDVPDFGCSDCRCNSHLLYRPGDPVEEITGVFRNLGLAPVIKTIMRDEAKANV